MRHARRAPACRSSAKMRLRSPLRICRSRPPRPALQQLCPPDLAARGTRKATAGVGGLRSPHSRRWKRQRTLSSRALAQKRRPRAPSFVEPRFTGGNSSRYHPLKQIFWDATTQVTVYPPTPPLTEVTVYPPLPLYPPQFTSLHSWSELVNVQVRFFSILFKPESW